MRHETRSIEKPPKINLPVPEDQIIGFEKLDAACRKGCVDPECKMKPEDHWGMGIEPQCHATSRIHAFYDSRNHAMEFHCGICGRPIICVKIASKDPA